MPVPRAVKRSSSWASDLVHPAPLAAVGLLALNDHVLKGAGLLPGAVTGKLSDFAGLFFFPMLLAAAARGASLALRGRDVADRRSLAAAAALVTGAGFAAVKLLPAANALAARTWGVMVMDPSDLWALPMVGLAAAWMLRAAAHAGDRDDRRASESGDTAGTAGCHAPRSARDARRALDFAAMIAAGLASLATSKAPPPHPPPPPPPPPPVAVAVAEDPACAALSVDTCERTATQTLVVVRARSRTGEACTIDVLRAEEASSQWRVAADVLPKNIVVQGSESRTFALTFLRAIPPDERTVPLNARGQIGATGASGAQRVDDIAIVGDCSAN